MDLSVQEETIFHDASDPTPKTSHQIPQENQQERGSSNLGDNPRNELYCKM